MTPASVPPCRPSSICWIMAPGSSSAAIWSSSTP
ncbi:Phosphoglycerate kinase [Musa troglodytarum]|uniref:Phosphoglycerate kinase n=1 Tax=Musa troglodytarum TaxID=320322 RepID=A0A9E7L4M5_9LILI|nr:Phosphoglycerate kinase [Musa troglodytarum]URE37865.1 Phosphoglycerate kinase [Musa troglodytarum]